MLRQKIYTIGIAALLGGFASMTIPAGASATAVSPTALGVSGGSEADSQLVQYVGHSSKNYNKHHNKHHNKHNTKVKIKVKDGKHYGRYDHRHHGARYRHKHGRYGYYYDGWYYATPW